jgi:hypothetical protein
VSLAARAAVTWLALFVVMFANGTFRVLVLQPRLGEDRARQLASLTGLALALIVSWIFVRLSPEATPRRMLGVGLAWLACTVAFELLFGRYVSGMSWRMLLADYDVAGGRLWPLVLVGVGLGPWLWAVVARRG